MPFKSEKQRRFLWARYPAVAKRWAREAAATRRRRRRKGRRR